MRSQETDSYCEFDISDLSEIAAPPRSRLFHLAPIGIGTPHVESLAGYVARLAEEHRVTTGALLTEEILPLIVSDRAYLREAGVDPRYARAMNGVGDTARLWAETLEKLTLREDLRFLTMLTWTEVLSPMGLCRETRYWCPACLEAWLPADKPIYEPLLWSLKPITVCPTHHRQLASSCPRCRRQMPLLDSRTRPGHCSKCGAWLGQAEPSEGGSSSPVLASDLGLQMWVANRLGELVAAAPRLEAPPRREALRAALAARVEESFGGEIAAFARALSLPKNTAWMWLTGKNLPRIDMQLHICYSLDVSLAQLLGGERSRPDSGHTQLSVQPGGTLVVRKPMLRRPFDRSAEIQALLEAILAQADVQPMSMVEVARRLSYDRRFLFEHFPTLSRAISARYRAHVRGLSAERVFRIRRQVRNAVVAVYREEGRFPTTSRVGQRLGTPGIFRNPAARQAREEALKELGLI